MSISFEWYDDGGGTSGVHSGEGQLVWWYTPGGPNGRFGEVASEQSFDDYRQNGPPVDAPAEVIAQIDEEFGRKPQG